MEAARDAWRAGAISGGVGWGGVEWSGLDPSNVSMDIYDFQFLNKIRPLMGGAGPVVRHPVEMRPCP